VKELIAKGAQLIAESKKILVFTGAGLSTESGIPDFRSPGGIWDRYDPSDFYYQKIVSDQRAREKYWKMSSEYWEVMRDAKPNSAHLAIKKLEDMGKLLAIVTQNIDNLHQKAGNSPEKIIEIHGTAFAVTCLNCGKTYERGDIEQRSTTVKRIRGAMTVPVLSSLPPYLLVKQCLRIKWPWHSSMLGNVIFVLSWDHPLSYIQPHRCLNMPPPGEPSS